MNLSNPQLAHRFLLPLVLLFTLLLHAPLIQAEPAINATPVVNINQAGAEELAEALHGVGISRARAIVKDREANGPYDSPEALTRVRGIGPSTIENNRDRIRLN